MRLPWILLTVLGLATLAAGCGQGETVTQVRTVTTPPATQGTAPAQTVAPGQTPPTDTATAPATPLPGGRAAVDGRYLMKIRSTDYEGQNIVAGMSDGEESTWPISTECAGETCRLNVRRELESGAFENFTLEEVKDRTYAATSTGKTECIVGASDKVDTKQRLSVRVTAIAQINGRPTAQRLDAYMTIKAKCGNQPVRGIISWRGTRLP